jgi:Mn2+/Fe2+ NRAMP family transporter
MSDARSPDDIEAPPQHPLAILRKLGPGLIIAASIVGSGELIMTTLTGAQAGMTLLWLIIIGCMVKVFAQIEIGRYTLASGKPTLTALAEVPGPRIEGRGNWLVWYWFVMWFLSIGQLGGIAGGVGQTLSIAMPPAVDRCQERREHRAGD